MTILQLKRILVPTDFSRAANNAVDYASALAKKFDAEIIFYHAYPIPIVDVNMPASVFLQVTQESENNARHQLDELCTTTKSRNTDYNLKCSYIIGQDFDSAKVSETAKENNIDLIIIGTHGTSGISEFFIGTNAARVVEKADCPVLTIPENFSFNTINKILFTTDYHDTDFPALKSMVSFAQSFNAEIIVMHVFQHDRKLESHMLEWFKEELENHISYNKIEYVLDENENIIESINNYIAQNNISMLVASTRKRNFLEKIFHKSITKKLTYHPQVPFLVFHYTKQDEVNVETS